MFYKNKLAIYLIFLISLLILSGCTPAVANFRNPFSFKDVTFLNESQYPLLFVYGPYSSQTGGVGFRYEYIPADKKNSESLSVSEKIFSAKKIFLDNIISIHVLRNDRFFSQSISDNNMKRTRVLPGKLEYIAPQILEILLNSGQATNTYSPTDFYKFVMKIQHLETYEVDAEIMNNSEILYEHATVGIPIGLIYITLQDLDMFLNTNPPIKTFSSHSLVKQLMTITNYEKNEVGFECIFNDSMELLCVAETVVL